MGYSHYARFGIMREDHDINQTWEGDNNVLLQQAAKFLLDMLKVRMKGKEIKTKTCEWLKPFPVEGETC
jgi:hypothetical protein